MGFWSGLAQGTLMSAATLAALSLAFPRDRSDDAGVGTTEATTDAPVSAPAEAEKPAAPVEPAVEAAAGQSEPAVAPEAQVEAPVEAAETTAESVIQAPDAEAETALAETAEASDEVAPEAAPETPPPVDAPEESDSAPVAEVIPDPVGSEFRRAGDQMPEAPDALAAPTVAAAPAVVAADVEASSPSALEVDVAPDEAIAPTAPRPLQQGPESPEEIAAPQVEAPIPVPPPGMVVVPSLDRLPERSTPAAEPVDVAVSQPEADADDQPAEPSTAPAPSTLPIDQPVPEQSEQAARPAPDLTLPQVLTSTAQRSVPTLSEPSATSPARPDLSDINPEAN